MLVCLRSARFRRSVKHAKENFPPNQKKDNEMRPSDCPKCGAPIQLWDKDTSTGRDILTYGCDACKWHESFDEGIALWKAMSDANEEFSKSEPPVIPKENFETPHDHAVKDRPATELSAEVKTEETVTAGDDSIFLTGWNNLPEGERQYYLDGYNDCFSYRHTPSGYNPPAGHEKAYKEGWEARRSEEDEQLLREWTGLP
jgi:hypothetical protein